MIVNHHRITHVYLTEIQEMSGSHGTFYFRDLVTVSKSGRVEHRMYSPQRDALDDIRVADRDELTDAKLGMPEVEVSI